MGHKLCTTRKFGKGCEWQFCVEVRCDNFGNMFNIFFTATMPRSHRSVQTAHFSTVVKMQKKPIEEIAKFLQPVELFINALMSTLFFCNCWLCSLSAILLLFAYRVVEPSAKNKSLIKHKERFKPKTNTIAMQRTCNNKFL